MQKLDLHNEQGRSMVEMLGVLAIIGVLSIMGIAGYRSAMTKLRSNELLNEASKRAVVVAGQITLQGGNPSLSEFANNSFAGGSFENRVYGASGEAEWTNTGATPDQRFTLSITGVEGNICAQMKSAVGDNAVIKHFAPETCDTGNDNNVKLTYNNDLGTENIETTGNDTPAAEPCPEERQCGDVCCGEGHTCQNGQCCDGNGNCCTGGVPYIVYQEGSHIETECCVNGAVFTYVNNEDVFAQGCCETGHTLINLGNVSACCATGETAYISDDGATCCDGTIWNDNTCCPAGTTSYSDLDGCCEAGTTETWQVMGGGDSRCCPIGSIGYDPDNDICCVSNSITYETFGDTHCCPPGSTDWNEDDGCIQ